MSELKITLFKAVMPKSAEGLISQISEFTHLKTDEMANNKILLLTTILSDGINLGLTKMTESCPSTAQNKLSWLHSWYIRDETYTSALVVLTKVQLAHDFVQNWGDGTTLSSDGQRFKAGRWAKNSGNINPKYGSELGRLIYTNVSIQYKLPAYAKSPVPNVLSPMMMRYLRQFIWLLLIPCKNGRCQLKIGNLRCVNS